MLPILHAMFIWISCNVFLLHILETMASCKNRSHLPLRSRIRRMKPVIKVPTSWGNLFHRITVISCDSHYLLIGINTGRGQAQKS